MITIDIIQKEIVGKAVFKKFGDGYSHACG